MRRDTIRKLYRDAIVQVFGCGDSELDSDLLRAVKSDVHYSDRAPGQWTGEDRSWRSTVRVEFLTLPTSMTLAATRRRWDATPQSLSATTLTSGT